MLKYLLHFSNYTGNETFCYVPYLRSVTRHFGHFITVLLLTYFLTYLHNFHYTGSPL